MAPKENILKLPARLVQELGGQGTYFNDSAQNYANVSQMRFLVA
jgi:hypothetical protein